MDLLLMKAIIFIIFALVFYTIGVWWEHLSKQLKKPHLVCFWMGLVMDAAGTRMMSLVSQQHDINSSLISLHGITGAIAILLMLIHAVWATIVLAQNNEKAKRTFHRFSLAVWGIWLIPFILGMIMGMK